MSNKPTLVYFPGRGRAEIIRLTLAAAGVEWDEVAVTPENLPELKASGKLAFGQVPLLQIDGHNLVQSVSSARYVAKKYDLYGDLFTGTTADIILDGGADLLNKLIPAIYPTLNKEKLAELQESAIPAALGSFQKILEQNNGGDGFVSGNALSFGDIALFQITESFVDDYHLATAEAFPKLYAHKQRVAAVPNIAAYLSSSKRFPPRPLQ